MKVAVDFEALCQSTAEEVMDASPVSRGAGASDSRVRYVMQAPMESAMMDFPVPPGLSQAELSGDSIIVRDYGGCVALYSVRLDMGGIYRRDPGVWQLWFPIGLSVFMTVVSRFLAANGYLDQAVRADSAISSSMTLN